MNFFKNIKEHAKNNKNIRTAVNIAFGLLAFNLLINLLKAMNNAWHVLKVEDLPTWMQIIYEALNHPVLIFFEHSWIEIFSAVIIYILLEDSIAKHFSIPKKEGSRDYTKMIQFFAKPGETTNEIKILDISIHEFLKDENYEELRRSLSSVIKTTDESGVEFTIRILLLHPNTYLKELREKDFTSDTRKILENMKKSLGKLSHFIEEIKNSNDGFNIQVKLYHPLPLITFTSWDDKSYFSAPPPNDPEQTYLMNTQTDLGEAFTKYFDVLWRSKNQTIDLYSYLYVIIKIGTKTYPRILWCGGSGESDLPRYIVPYLDSATFLSHFTTAPKEYFLVEHNGKNSKARLKSILMDPNSSEYNFAKKRIHETFEILPNDFGDNVMFQLEYLSEHGREIRINDPSFIGKRMDRYGCCFVSHKQYDVNMTTLVEKFIGCLNYCVNNLLEEDKYDVDAIKEIRGQCDYKNNPRKRLFLQFECDLEKSSKMTELKADASSFDCNFQILHEAKGRKYYSKIVKTKKYRSYLELSQFCKARGENDYKMLTALIDNLKSIIESDISYILGEECFSTCTDVFIVDVNVIRTEVNIDNPIAYPTPNGYVSPRCDYKVLHLINRYDVTGGVTDFCIDTIKEDNPDESFLLNKPMDTIFEQRKTITKKQVLSKSEPISLKNNKLNGVRDILVLSINKKKID